MLASARRIRRFRVLCTVLRPLRPRMRIWASCGTSRRSMPKILAVSQAAQDTCQKMSRRRRPISTDDIARRLRREVSASSPDSLAVLTSQLGVRTSFRDRRIGKPATIFPTSWSVRVRGCRTRAFERRPMKSAVGGRLRRCIGFRYVVPQRRGPDGCPFCASHGRTGRRYVSIPT